MMSQLYSTAENAPGSLAWRLKTRQLEAAREMGRCIGGIVIAAVFLIAIGDAFGVLISNTDSAAPIGVYRVVSGEPKRQPACRSRSHSKVLLAAICGRVRAPATPSRSARSSARFQAIRFKWKAVGFR